MLSLPQRDMPAGKLNSYANHVPAKPNTKIINQLVSLQAELDYRYLDDGVTLSLPPSGYIVDHTRFNSGFGELIFKSTLLYCQQMGLGWGDVWSLDARD